MDTRFTETRFTETRLTATRFGKLARLVGRGAAAGLVGTVVMTVGQLIEMKLSGRGPSATPARAVETLLGVEIDDERTEQRLAQLVHFAYGSAWGVPRALLGLAGARAATASSVHLLLVWGAALAMLPRLGVAPPVREWPKAQLAEDLGMHLVYAAATGAAYEWLRRR